MRRDAKPGKVKAKARRPAVRKSPKNEGARGRDLERRLAESLKQQAATAEILRVIGSSPMDTQPVFDGIVRSGVNVCGSRTCTLFVVDGDMVRVAATHGVPVERLELFRTQFPAQLSGENQVAQVLRERRIFHLADIEHNPAATPEDDENARVGRYRTRLMVPMLRGDSALGMIAVTRQEPTPFTDQQIALLQTFADQAVIAIENVRLFTELHASNHHLTDALDQQTATAEILRVISGTPTDAQPVFDTIVRNAGRVCDAVDAVLSLRQDNELIVRAHWGPIGIQLGRRAPLTEGSVMGRTIVDARPIHVADLSTASEFPEGRELALRWGIRTALGVPLLRDGNVLGALQIRRTEVRPFSDAQIARLQTFADQAVIAIENVRLFTELQARNAEVTVALEQQTATSEILRVISSSPTSLEPVFSAILSNATILCEANLAALWRYDGEYLVHGAAHNASPEFVEFIKRNPQRPSPEGPARRAAFEGRPVHVVDLLSDPSFKPQTLHLTERARTVLAIPLLRERALAGVIILWRRDVRAFTDRQIALLQTFADQAVIAVENVRLFKELQARTNELTRSVDQLTALGEISQAVSSTLDVETVLQTIVSRASQLAGADGCAIYEYDDATEAFHIRATHNLDPVLVGRLRASPLRKGEGTMGRAAETREPIQVADIAVPGAYQSHVRDTLLEAGYRALLSVPLLREGEVIGSLSLNRHAPGEFPPEAVEVLKTFATQSALAIQNARLFRELADKSAQLEAASRHKSEFLANMSHELRTPLNAIIGFSEVLNERMFGELNDKQAEYLKDIHASGQHLLSLINDILDLSKVEAGRMELELTDFDLPAAVDNAVTLVRERAGRKNITVRIAVEEQVGMMRGDERKIRQVLLNLLSNAIKFTPEGGRIEVAAVSNDGSVEVSVRDTGVGIAPEDHEAVFEEFRQVGASAAKQEGTGLGLALARKFIELHGGKIWVTSQVGAGSTFTFTLPFERPAGA